MAEAPKRVAVLDVGSNSVRLLVAERSNDAFVPIHQARITSRLLQGLQDGQLHPDSIQRTFEAIQTLSEEARTLGASEICAFGTSAMRDGQNRDQLIRAVAPLGIELAVLSGEQEAELSYRGAAPEGQVGVIDIGGGSTELLAGADGRVLASHSAQIGAVRLIEMLGPNATISQMEHTSAEILLSTYEAVRTVPVTHWVGLGGTITTLAAMELRLSEYSAALIEKYPVERSAAESWLQKLFAMPTEERKQIPGMNPARADIMPYGLSILCAFFALTGAERVFASDCDNLMGYLIKKWPLGG